MNFVLCYEREREDGSITRKVIGKGETIDELNALAEADFATRFTKRRKPYTDLCNPTTFASGTNANKSYGQWHWMTGGWCNHEEEYTAYDADNIPPKYDGS
jgi:hypothetical protein